MKLRALARETVIYAVGNTALRAGAFLLIPLYTHTLNIRDYGVLATLLLTMQILGILMGLGVRTAFVRFCAEYAEAGKLGRLLGSAYALVLAGGVAVTAVAISVMRPLFAAVLHTAEPGFLVFLTCMAALAQTLWMLTVSYFRARNKGVQFVVLNGAVFVLLASSSAALLLQLRMGLQGVIAAYIGSYGLMWVVVSVAIAMRTGLAVERSTMRRLVRFGFPLIFSMSGDIAIDGSALYAMSLFAGLDQVAVYSLGYKIAQIAVITLILPFQLAYEPAVYGAANSPLLRRFIAEALIHLLLVFGFVALAIVLVFRDLMPLIAPPEYARGYDIVFALLPGVACMGIHYVGESLLLIPGKTKLAAGIVCAVTVAGVLLNVLLIRVWGMHGAVAVYDLTHAAMALLLLGVGMRHVPVALQWRRLAGSVALPFTGLAAVWWLSRVSSAPLFYALGAAAVLIILGGAKKFGVLNVSALRTQEAASYGS